LTRSATVGDVRERRIRERLMQGTDLLGDGPEDKLIE
jgi:hypothetical protein